LVCRTLTPRCRRYFFGSAPEDIQSEGPAHVLLGRSGAVSSVIESPSPITDLAVLLKAGEVHTTPAALREAEAHIRAIRRRLVQEGRL
jgi:hypothetical protein